MSFHFLLRDSNGITYFFFYFFIGLFDKVHANHVLVNEYLPGQGIMPHSDGPLFYPVICTISCGSHAVLEFYEKEQDGDDKNMSCTQTSNGCIAKNHSAISTSVTNTTSSEPLTNSMDSNPPKRKLVCQLLIEPGSLLILKDDMYNKYLHSISEVTEDLITNNFANIERCVGFKNRIGEIVKRDRRISLTIRHVPKTTSKLKLRLGH